MTALDRYITDNYTFLVQIARGIIYKSNREYAPEQIVNGAYLHLVDKGLRDADRDTIQRSLIAYIRNDISWHNSKTNIKKGEDRLTPHLELTLHQEDVDIDKEVSHELKLASIYEYYNKTTRVNQLLLDNFIANPNVTIRDLALKYDLNISSIHSLLKTIKNDIKRRSYNQSPCEEGREYSDNIQTERNRPRQMG